MSAGFWGFRGEERARHVRGRLTTSVFRIQYRRHGPSGAEQLRTVVLLRAVSKIVLRFRQV